MELDDTEEGQTAVSFRSNWGDVESDKTKIKNKNTKKNRRRCTDSFTREKGTRTIHVARNLYYGVWGASSLFLPNMHGTTCVCMFNCNKIDSLAYCDWFDSIRTAHTHTYARIHVLVCLFTIQRGRKCKFIAGSRARALRDFYGHEDFLHGQSGGFRGGPTERRRG